MDIYKGEIFINLVTAGKCDSEELRLHLEEVNEVPPKFGRNWWYNVPKFSKVPLGWTLAWLCFMVTYDNYNNKIEEMCCS